MNEMGVKLYLEVKKSKSRLAMYPLCIDTSEKIGDDIHNSDETFMQIDEVLALVEDALKNLPHHD